ncbi:hypothetical protein Dsin_026606 [Dipteronia sinensis]|uniref:Uncharacterized protein n=1 Tax=Dipteronia sinensis TaxID=43782 RepID=A0AAD9ZY72_9ROSI|nr:hypothetical protein Dsin_026606 [Dipteronia sinensis]
MDLDFSFETDHQKASPRSVESCETISRTKRRRDLFLASIGYHEFFSPEMWKAALTELVATACLIFTLTTSIISCLDSHESEPKLLVPFAVFIIAFLFLLVTVPLTGGHMSPVFTFIAALKGIITLTRAAAYVLAQCIGSIISFVIIKSVMSHNAAERYSFGGCTIARQRHANWTYQPGNCTYTGVYMHICVAFDKRRCKELGLAMVCAVVAGAMALAVFVSITVTGQAGYAGVGLNPARCLGPALLHGGPLWEAHWVFWVGPFIACTVYYGFTKSLPNET